jgi:hypothetical protein
MDVNLNGYPIKDQLPGYNVSCVGDSGGPSIDGIGGAGSDWNVDSTGGGNNLGGGGGVGGDGGSDGVGGIDLGGCQTQ